MRTGILLVIIGIFVIARTVQRDATERTLPDRILGWGPGHRHGGKG